jgi:hypothetical protein
MAGGKGGLIMEYLGLPLWGDYLLKGILIFAGLSSAAVVLTRAGRSPYLAFVLVVPFVQVIAIWLLAFADWSKRQND